MDIGRAFGAPWRDSKLAGKLALGVVIMIVPILNFAIAGWGINYIRSVAHGHDDQLPSWNDLGSHWAKGVGFIFAQFVYYVPAIGIVILFGAPAIPVASSISDPGTALATMLGSLGTGLFLALVYLVIVSVLVQAARVNYAMYGEISAAFSPLEVLRRVGRNPGGYFIAWVMSIVTLVVWYAVAIFVNGALGAIPCVGPVVMLLMLPVMMGLGLGVGMTVNALFGQYAAQAYDTGAAATGAPSYPPPGPIAPSAPAVAPTRIGAGVPAVAAATAGASSAPAPTAVVATIPPAGSGTAAIAAAVAAARARRPVAEAGEPEAGSVLGTVISTPASSPELPVVDDVALVDDEPQLATVELPRVSSADPPVASPEVSAAAEPAVADPEASTLAGDLHEEVPKPQPATDVEAPGVPIVSVTEPRSQKQEESVVSAPAEPAVEPVSEMSAPAEATLEPVPDVPASVEPAVESQSGAPASDEPPAPLVSAAAEPADLAGVASFAQPAEQRVDRVWTLTSSDGETWQLPRNGDVRIGRDEACFISLEDGRISRHHAVVAIRDGVVSVFDAGSANGTRVNGERVGAEARTLEAGDIVGIGGVELALGSR